MLALTLCKNGAVLRQCMIAASVALRPLTVPPSRVDDLDHTSQEPSRPAHSTSAFSVADGPCPDHSDSALDVEAPFKTPGWKTATHWVASDTSEQETWDAMKVVCTRGLSPRPEFQPAAAEPHEAQQQNLLNLVTTRHTAL
eukprot:TRINITY_DN1941_c0_g1_i3.p3 TRINITY_DN1941_c0_g1~~TRINITY_DN1941_c0_g1_i3.p3  ORF type:complete len:141 (+),score=16.52 TRINITY_DN1941_c0_g1_i3:164-586(+)